MALTLRSLLFTRQVRPAPEARARILNLRTSQCADRTGMKFLRKNLLGDKVLWYEKNFQDCLRPEGLTQLSEDEQYWQKKKVELVARGKGPTKKHEGKKKSRRK